MKDKLISIVKQAGEMLKEGYFSQKEITFKAKKDLVTTYDVAIENFLKETFAKEFNEFSIIAEESDNDNIEFKAIDIFSKDFSDSAGYAFSEGFFIAYEDGFTERSSSATVAVSNDGLFLSFRGSDVLGDWLDDAFDMTGHYDRFKPLFTQIDEYLTNHPDIKNYRDPSSWLCEDPSS